MRIAALLVAAAALAAPSVALAAPPISDAEVSRRLAFIEGRLERGLPAAKRWWYGWYAGFTVLTTAQAIGAIAIKDPGFRADLAVGAVTSSLGVIPLGLLPFPPLTAPAELHRLPASTAEQRRRKLARAERLLRASAEAEIFGRSWVAHVAGLTVSIAGGLVLALAYKRVVTGIIDGLVGVAIVETQIFTRPTAAIRDWKEYSALGGSGSTGSRRRTNEVTWTVSPWAGGLGITGQF